MRARFETRVLAVRAMATVRGKRSMNVKECRWSLRRMAGLV